MCFGFDGQGALRRSLEEKGAGRRSVLRGAAAGAAGLAALGAVSAPAHAGPGKPAQEPRVKHQVFDDEISIQMYTLRAAMTTPAGVDLVLERLSQYGYSKVELAGLYGRTALAMRAQLDGLGIRASSSHDGISATPAALQTKLDNAVTLGQTFINVPFLRSDVLADWQRWADQMNAEALEARKYGLKYGYHNHAHEFTIDLGGGLTPWEVLTERLDPRLVHLEADLYWVYTGGVNTGQADPDQFVIDTLAATPQRVRQFHVKDRDAATGDFADLGTGLVDFPRIFAAHKVGEYIVENDTPDVTPLTSAAVGRLFLENVSF